MSKRTGTSTLKPRFLFTLFLTAVLICSSKAWSMQGHSIIASIAEKLLKENNPEIHDSVIKTLSTLTSFFPETKGSLLEAAALPDMLNFEFEGFNMMYHFIDNPIVYVKDSASDVDIPHPQEQENVVKYLKNSVKIIKDSLAKNYTKNIKPGFMDSLMLRYVLHLTGDIHQPLHNSSLFAKDLFNGKIRSGDVGGNLIPVNDIFNKKINNLHSLYDSAFNTFDYKKATFPFNKDLQKTISDNADWLMKEYPRSYFGKESDNLLILDWSKESLEIAENFVYSQVELFPILQPEYILQGRIICQERMALSAYRLYNLLKDIYSSDNKVNKESVESE